MLMENQDGGIHLSEKHWDLEDECIKNRRPGDALNQGCNEKEWMTLLICRSIFNWQVDAYVFY